MDKKKRPTNGRPLKHFAPRFYTSQNRTWSARHALDDITGGAA